MVRCKYICQSVTKKKHWDRNNPEFLFEAEFTPVTGGSEEDKAFYAATPHGSLKIGTYKVDHFTPGVAYYLDLTVADPVPVA